MIKGGPKRETYKVDNVIPINFSSTDPFGDIGTQFNILEKIINADEMTDIIIIARRKTNATFETKIIWRGENSFTTALGMLEYGKILLRDYIDVGVD